MKVINKFNMNFPSKSANEAFARSAIAAFCLQLDPTIDEITDIKTAVSEAVTNAIVHGYSESIGTVYISAQIRSDNSIAVKIRDKGCGIENVEKAMEPLYTTVGGERAGLGFAVMENFTDSLSVRSKVGSGTTVTMVKKISRRVGVNDKI
ncbi:MAG: anti-sigma F factor [Clostridiales bacterium]|nr:anti-sigma F factor [Candidatus Equinaster intestinalis]